MSINLNAIFIPSSVMKFILKSSAIAILLAGSAASNAAVTLGQPTVFNTGVSSSGVPLPVGSVDPHWTVVSGPGVAAPFQAAVSNTVSLYTFPADASWIWTNAAAVSGTNSPYIFRTTFTLSAAEASSATLSGAWAVDNLGSVRLNGANPIGTGTFVLSGVVFENFNRLHAFSITGGFVEGVNTLDFIATDTGDSAGLIVSRLAIAPVPEAGTLSMFAVGGAYLLLSARRRARQSKV